MFLMMKIVFQKGIFCFKKQAYGNPGPKGRFLGEGNGDKRDHRKFAVAGSVLWIARQVMDGTFSSEIITLSISHSVMSESF